MQGCVQVWIADNIGVATSNGMGAGSMMQLTKTKAIERLQKALDEISELRKLQRNSQEFEKWRRNTEVAIRYTFGNDSRHVEDFSDIRFSLPMYTNVTPDYEFQQAYLRGLDSSKSILDSMIEEIEEYWEEDVQSSNWRAKRKNGSRDLRKVFVIHGHDEAARETVARFLERLELTPIILHEQPNQGRTIIEKFEDHSDVGFAIVLLTPDDIGAAARDKDNLKPRARQNVILELGFFIGTLGRQRVCILVKDTVETPSDYDGVVYTILDGAKGWQVKIIQELKAAGFSVDANRVIGP